MKKQTSEQLSISKLGFGAWPLGNTAHGQTMSTEEGIELVKAALKKGINFFDTAPNYAKGRSETILGMALEGVRYHVYINTKFGHNAEDKINFDEAAIRPSIKGSLKRLKTDYLDSVILHNPNEAILKGETKHFEILKTLKQEGLINAYGVSVDTYNELETVLTHQSTDVIELLYNIFFQPTRALLDKVKEKNIKLIIKVPLDSGWLTGKYNETSTFSDIRTRWTKEDLRRRDQLVTDLKAVLPSDDLVHYAMRFLWSYDAVTTVIPGIRTMNQLKSHTSISQDPLDAKLLKQLENFYDDKIKNNPLPW